MPSSGQDKSTSRTTYSLTAQPRYLGFTLRTLKTEEMNMPTYFQSISNQTTGKPKLLATIFQAKSRAKKCRHAQNYKMKQPSLIQATLAKMNSP